MLMFLCESTDALVWCLAPYTALARRVAAFSVREEYLGTGRI